VLTKPLSLTLQRPFKHYGGFLWRADLPHGFAEPSDTNEMPANSLLRLTEAETPIGPAHAWHAEIEREGRGRYSHHGGALWFSTSDGSDPNTNDRRYTVAIGEPTLKLLGLGSCHVNLALMDLHKRGLAYSLWGDFGITYTPRETLQMIEYHFGRLEIPRAVEAFALPTEPGENTLSWVVRNADVVFLELRTSRDIAYGPFWIASAKLMKNLLAPISALGEAERRIAWRWYHGLIRQNELVRRDCAEQLLRLIPKAKVDMALARDVVEKARGARQDEDVAADTIGRIRDVLGAKTLCLVSSQDTFMPDGRPVSWPANFPRDLESISRKLSMPLFHPGSLVAKLGVSFSLEGDLSHFTPEFLTFMGSELLAMSRRALNGG